VDASASSAGEVGQANITWLDPVWNEQMSFSVQVPAGGYELPGNDTLWMFYYRLNPPAAPQDCYTGVGAGERGMWAEAVKT
jgi:hypothetical protein